MLKKVKTITSHSGLARWLAETDETSLYLARAQVKEIPSPYAYSPVKSIELWKGKLVVWFETRHKRYEVFEVPPEMLKFTDREQAVEYHIKSERESKCATESKWSK